MRHRPAAPQPRTAKPVHASLLDGAFAELHKMAAAIFSPHPKNLAALSAVYAQHPGLRALSEQTADRRNRLPTGEQAELFHQYMQVNSAVTDDYGHPVADYFLEFFSNTSKAHDEAKSRTGLDLALYGQEMDNATSALARMNMVLHDCPTAEIWQGI